MPVHDAEVKTKLRLLQNDIELLGKCVHNERGSASTDARHDTDYVLEAMRQTLIGLLEDSGPPPHLDEQCAAAQEAAAQKC